MTLGRRLDNPKPLIVAGMAVLAVAESWPRMLPIGRELGPDWIDGIRGALFGIAIPLLLRAAWLNGRSHRGTE